MKPYLTMALNKTCLSLELKSLLSTWTSCLTISGLMGIGLIFEVEQWNTPDLSWNILIRLDEFAVSDSGNNSRKGSPANPNNRKYNETL